MKKWLIVTLFALLTMLLLCAACAEDGHNWKWDTRTYPGKRVRYCDGCASHTGRYEDARSIGNHSYKVVRWPETITMDNNGDPVKPELPIRCKTCGHTTSAIANLGMVIQPDCTNDGSVTYTCYEDNKTYVIPAIGHNLTEHHEAKAPTCTDSGWEAYDACTRTNCNYTTRKDIPALKHKLALSNSKASTCTEKGWEEYSCQNEGCDYVTRADIDQLTHDTIHYDGKTPTCTEIGYDAYDTCQREGCDYTTYQEIPATGHSYTKKTVKPTCEKGGYTEYTCEACGDQYTDQHKSKLLHWFSAWTGNGNGTHSAACKRDGCDHIGKTDCAMQEIKLGDATITYCPVCGDTQNGNTFSLIEGSAAKALTKRLPQGEPVLRTLAWTDGATLLSAGFEYAGKLTQPTGAVEFTLPAALIEGKTLSILNADGTQEILTCTIDGDTAAFTLDFTDSKDPVQLIQITPAA